MGIDAEQICYKMVSAYPIVRRIKIIGKTETVTKKKINRKFRENFFTPGIFETLPSGKSRGKTALRFTVSVTKYETTKLRIASRTKKTVPLNKA